MAQTIRPRTKVVYNTQQERMNSTPAGVAAYDAANPPPVSRGTNRYQQERFNSTPAGVASYDANTPASANYPANVRGGMIQSRRPSLSQAQQPQSPQFGGQPAPPAGTPQAANWMQGRAGVSGATAPFLQPFATDEPAAYGSPLTRNYDARIANIRGQANAASTVYNQMGRPSAGSQFAQNQAAGYTTDQYGRQYQMTPQMAGTAMPQGGAGGWMQGQSLGGAPHGVYVQSNLPAPGQAGMDRVAAGQQGLRPSAFSGPKSSAAIAGMAGFGETAGTGPGAQRYNNMKARRQQMADQRIVARARMRGLGQNTPAVRAAMQRQGMLTPGQGTQGGITTPVAPGAAAPVSGQVSAAQVDRHSRDRFVVGALGGEYVSSKPENFVRAFGLVKTPEDHRKIAEAWRDRVAIDPEIGKQVSENPVLKERFDAFTGGVDSWKKYGETLKERQKNLPSDYNQSVEGARSMGFGDR